MKTYGLIGKSLEHSFSPGYFSRKFKNDGMEDCEYLLFPLKEIEEFNHLRNLNLSGLNVTIPYKEQIIPYLDELDFEANQLNAVNTIAFKGGRLIGYNTDVYGFEKSLLKFIPDTHFSALILGSGGASKAVQFILNKCGIDYKIVSRSKDFLNYGELDYKLLSKRKLIINTTPLGMFPKIDEKPDIPYDLLSGEHYVYDLIYNPEKTLFLKKAESKGASIKNGYEMLCLQADRSWEIWNKE